MQQTTLTSNSHSQQYINHIKRLQCQPSESQSSLHSQEITQTDGDRAILEFKREIEERFKISIANKLYSFPLRMQSIDDLLSSEEDEEDPQQEDPEEEDEEWNQMLSKRIERVEIKPQKEKSVGKGHVRHEKGFKKKKIALRESHQKEKEMEKKRNGCDTFSSEKRVKGKKSGKKEIKNQTFRHEKEATRSKRINTEPDQAVNYLDTLRPKARRRNN